VPYLTPESVPDGFVCRTITIPDSTEFLGLVTGALLTLSQVWNYEQSSPTALTPDEIASIFLNIYFEFRDGGDNCMLGAIIPSIVELSEPAYIYCNGDTRNRVDFPRLYAVLPAEFIVDDDTFILPDLQGVVLGGFNASSIFGFDELYDTVGEFAHTLFTSELPSHAHGITPHSHSEGTTTPTTITIGPGAPAPAAIGALGTTGTALTTTDNAGGGESHNNIQPTFILKMYIVAN